MWYLTTNDTKVAPEKTKLLFGGGGLTLNMPAGGALKPRGAVRPRVAGGAFRGGLHQGDLNIRLDQVAQVLHSNLQHAQSFSSKGSSGEC